MRLALATLVIAAALAPSALAQSSNMTLVGQLDPRPEGYADIWGYAAPNGREYAVLSTRSDGGMTVIDVTTMPPVEVEFFPGSGGQGSDVEMYGPYVYYSDDQAPTRIVSLANPADPVFVGSFGTDAHTISVAGGYLFTQGGPSPSGVMIYSLANPESPVLVGQYQPGFYIHDILVVGDVMYTAGIYGDGIDIVDISNPASPQLINRFDYPGSGAHNICADASGDYVYVGDEIGSGQWTRIFDVSDPMNVTQVGEIILTPSTTVHNCHVKGNLLYLGYYDGYGARVYDITNPTAPVEIAYYETGTGMMWSVYPHLPSGKVLGSLYQGGGLRVFTLDTVVNGEGGPETPAALALAAPSPNPVSGAADLRFTLPEATRHAQLAVYDALGRTVATLHEGALGAGTHARRFDASVLPAGVYFARLEADGRAATQALTVVH